MTTNDGYYNADVYNTGFTSKNSLKIDENNYTDVSQLGDYIPVKIPVIDPNTVLEGLDTVVGDYNPIKATTNKNADLFTTIPTAEKIDNSEYYNEWEVPIKKDGTYGIFDIMMRAVEEHLTAQYRSGRITGENYATAYISALNMVLQQATLLLAQNKQMEVQHLAAKAQADQGLAGVRSQIAQANIKAFSDVETANRKLESDSAEMREKVKLLGRQREAFNDDRNTKLVKNITDMWSVGYSVAGVSELFAIPRTMQKKYIEKVIKGVTGGYSNQTPSKPNEWFSDLTPENENEKAET